MIRYDLTYIQKLTESSIVLLLALRPIPGLKKWVLKPMFVG